MPGEPGDRLDSWKEIAAYLKRDVTTVQRWEKREGMPVHRHLHDKMGSIYAYRSDLDAWARTRAGDAAASVARAPAEPTRVAPATEAGHAVEADRRAGPRAPRSGAGPSARTAWSLAMLGAALASAVGLWHLRAREAAAWNPLAEARYVRVTDFDGVELAAALSRDGRFVAFQSDRDGRMDVWVTELGTGRFVNLTGGAAKDIANASLRALGFSPDGTLVTYWARSGAGTQRDISVWAVPLVGGAPRPYLENAAEYAWTSDGSRLVFHRSGPGDPMFVRDAGPTAETRNIFSAPAGLHAHYLVWSPDREFIYFVQGQLPDRLDIWRIRPAGGPPERITRHESTVTHPVFVDDRTLLYLATDPDGLGPWIHVVDVERGVPRRVSAGVDGYTSLSGSADGRRLVATHASPKRTLWRVRLDGARADMAAARRVPLATGNAFFARLGPDFLLYVSRNGTGDSLWKAQGDTTTELWSAENARIIGAPAIDREGRRVAFPVRQRGRKVLHVVNVDGSGAREVPTELDLQGAPAWAPAGEFVTIAAVVSGTPRLFQLPLDGGPATPLVADHSVDPVWSPRGDVLAFTGADIGTTFPLRFASSDGTPRQGPAMQLTRGARHLAFMPDGDTVLLLKGEIRHKDVWMLDLRTGAERPVTELGPEFELRDFDLSPDGRELVLEQVQEQSDVVLIERTDRR